MTRTLGKWLVASVTLAVLLAVSPANLRAKDNKADIFHPVITLSEGNVMVMGQEYSLWEPAPEGTLLLSGDKVKTGWDSRAEIRFLSGVVKLYENSLLIIPSIGVQDRKKDIQDMVVEEGEVLFDINPLGAQRQFEFRTKNVQGGVKGTVFKVRCNNDETTVGVYEGKVWVSEPDRKRSNIRILKAGQAVHVDTVNDLVEFTSADLDTPDEYVEKSIDDRDKVKDNDDKDKDKDGKDKEKDEDDRDNDNENVD